MSARIDWSPWTPLPDLPPFSADSLRELLDGGQAFRWYVQPDGSWRGGWVDWLVELRLGGTTLEYRALRGHATSGVKVVASYLAAGSGTDALLDALPWRSDAHLRQCLQAFPGLRILRQPFGETLLCFLCSATKQIVQIKQMVALLAERLGESVAPGWNRLPRWETLARVPITQLQACLLGFRARYIHATAQFLAEHPGWLEETERLPYPAAKERLCLLPGVGEKVADCVLLFGAGRMEAFPVDVWIIKTMARRYGLEGWRPAQIAQFGRAHFGAGAGLAQQFLFAWERKTARVKREAGS
ncbi:DNA-binding protein [Opitutaceae bacterium EW11]|nr:DNA-binding protein [Opitutaceae bacterium EW11]